MDPLLSSVRRPQQKNKKMLLLSALTVMGVVTACVFIMSTPSLSFTISKIQSSDEEGTVLRSLFEQWKLSHAKTYSTVEEEAYRFNIFVEAHKYITEYNSQGNTAVLALNKFSDLTNEEFSSHYASGLAQEAMNPEDLGEEFSMEAPPGGLPDEWDWRNKSIVSPVMSEGQCGSTYIFAPVWALESYYAIKNNYKLTQFSYQQVLDCDTADYGCNGGWPTNVLNYTATYGIEPYSQYPYTGGKVGTCQYDKSLAIKANVGYAAIPPKSVNLLQTAAYATPVSVNVESDQKVFQYYSSGVITTGCGNRLTHCVTVVGWTNYNGTNAWITKNMWGTDWGMDGYVLIGMDPTANGGTGVCGILSGPLVPV